MVSLSYMAVALFCSKPQIARQYLSVTDHLGRMGRWCSFAIKIIFAKTV